jgi:hypothetical protein
MRKLLTIFAIALLGSCCAWAQVSFVNGAVATSSASSVTSLQVVYSPTAGNEVVLALEFASSASSASCKDQNNNTLSSAHLNNTWLFYGTAITGATSYTASWTTSSKSSISIAEYSGVVGIGTGGNTATASTGPITITSTTSKQNSFMVAALGITGNVTATSSTGHLREKEPGGSGNGNTIGISDNTAVSSGSSVTNAASTGSGATWAAVSVELYPTQSVTSGFDKSRKLSRLGVL